MRSIHLPYDLSESQSTAFNMCLVSQSWRLETAPVLYSKIISESQKSVALLLRALLHWHPSTVLPQIDLGAYIQGIAIVMSIWCRVDLEDVTTLVLIFPNLRTFLDADYRGADGGDYHENGPYQPSALAYQLADVLRDRNIRHVALTLGFTRHTLSDPAPPY